MRLPSGAVVCPHCTADNQVDGLGHDWYFCNVCGKTFSVKAPPPVSAHP